MIQFSTATHLARRSLSPASAEYGGARSAEASTAVTAKAVHVASVGPSALAGISSPGQGPRSPAATGAASEALAASPLLAAFHGRGAAPAVIRIEDLVKEARLAMRDAGQVLQLRLAEHGIGASPPVDISFDSGGRAVVEEHPRQQDIRQLLDEDPGLEVTLRNAFCMQENAVIWQKAERFHLAYAATWQAKGQRVADQLFDRFMAMREPRHTLRFGPEGLDVRFDGMTGERCLAGVVKSLGLSGGIAVDAVA